MTAPKCNHKTDFTAQAKGNDVPESVVAPSGGVGSEDVPERYETREDLEKALNEAKKSEAHLRKIIDTIPTLAWCNLPDGSNEFVNRRWCDYTGLSPEEVQRVGCKVAIHPEDRPKWLDKWRTLVASGEGGEIEARLNVNLPGIEPEVAQALADAAHQTCPYSKATRGNIDVVINLV